MHFVKCCGKKRTLFDKKCTLVEHSRGSLLLVGQIEPRVICPMRVPC